MLNYLADPETNPDISAETIEGESSASYNMQNFNPNSQFAFQPPDYATVTKDPPKYEEVFVPMGATGLTAPEHGTINPCYVPDTPEIPVASGDASERAAQRNPDAEVTHNNECDPATEVAQDEPPPYTAGATSGCDCPLPPVETCPATDSVQDSVHCDDKQAEPDTGTNNTAPDPNV